MVLKYTSCKFVYGEFRVVVILSIFCGSISVKLLMFIFLEYIEHLLPSKFYILLSYLLSAMILNVKLYDKYNYKSSSKYLYVLMACPLGRVIKCFCLFDIL